MPPSLTPAAPCRSPPPTPCRSSHPSHPRDVPAGCVIALQGDDLDYVVVVLSGSASVHVAHHTPHHHHLPARGASPGPGPAASGVDPGAPGSATGALSLAAAKTAADAAGRLIEFIPGASGTPNTAPGTKPAVAIAEASESESGRLPVPLLNVATALAAMDVAAAADIAGRESVQRQASDILSKLAREAAGAPAARGTHVADGPASGAGRVMSRWGGAARIAAAAVSDTRRLLAAAAALHGPTMGGRLGPGATFSAPECATGAGGAPTPRVYGATMVAAERTAVALIPASVYRAAAARAIAPLMALMVPPVRNGHQHHQHSPGGGESLAHASVVALVTSHPLFHGLSPGALAKVMAAGETHRLAAAAPLTAANQPAAGGDIYLVVSGSLSVHAEANGPTGSLLCPGDATGAESLILGARRPATLLAREPSTVLAVPATALAAAIASAGIPTAHGPLAIALAAKPGKRTEADLTAMVDWLRPTALGAALGRRGAPPGNACRLLALLCQGATVETFGPGDIAQLQGGGVPTCGVALTGTLLAHVRDMNSLLDGAGGAGVTAPAVGGDDATTQAQAESEAARSSAMPHGPLYRILAPGDVYGLPSIGAALGTPLLPFDPCDREAITTAAWGTGGAAAGGEALGRILAEGTITAATASTVLVFRPGPASVAVGRAAAMDVRSAVRALALCGPLSDWPEASLADLIPLITAESLAPGEALTIEGEAVTALRIFRAGTAAQSGASLTPRGVTPAVVPGGGLGLRGLPRLSTASGDSRPSLGVTLPPVPGATPRSDSPTSAPVSGAGPSAEEATLLGRGDIAGFAEALAGVPAATTVRCRTPADFWTLDAARMRALAPVAAVMRARRRVMGPAFLASEHGAHMRAHTDLGGVATPSLSRQATLSRQGMMSRGALSPVATGLGGMGTGSLPGATMADLASPGGSPSLHWAGGGGTPRSVSFHPRLMPTKSRTGPSTPQGAWGDANTPTSEGWCASDALWGQGPLTPMGSFSEGSVTTAAALLEEVRYGRRSLDSPLGRPRPVSRLAATRAGSFLTDSSGGMTPRGGKASSSDLLDLSWVDQVVGNDTHFAPEIDTPTPQHGRRSLDVADLCAARALAKLKSFPAIPAQRSPI